MEDGLTPIGRTNYRQTNQVFGIKDKDRLGHIYCIGKTGVGKSTLLLNMALSDIRRGNGICLIEPHSDTSVTLRSHIPPERSGDLVYFNPRDIHNTVTFNPLQGIHPKYHSLVASGLIFTFKKVWVDSWGPRMEHILRYALLTLLYVPDSTLLDIPRLLTDDAHRNSLVSAVPEEHIRHFWQNEYSGYSKRFRAEAISPILNKMGLFNASAPLRRVLGGKGPGIRFSEIMNHKKILICNLSKGELGEETSMLLGAIILTSIQHAALHRARLPAEKRTPYYLYVDEMSSFVTLSFISILSESRKFGLSLFLAHQYIQQLDERIQSAIFGNVGTIIAFRVGATDAEYLAREFYPVFTEIDLINLDRYSVYLKLMIDGATSVPFSANTLPPAA